MVSGAELAGEPREARVAMTIPQLVRPGGIDYAANGVGRGSSARDVVDTMASNHRLEAFVAALQITGLTDLLRNAERVVIFAPTDEAFGRLGDAEHSALFSDRASLMRLLARHIRFDVFGSGPPGSLTPVGAIERVTANAAAPNQRARNGVIHIIDELM
jgi:hypothetical protein